MRTNHERSGDADASGAHPPADDSADALADRAGDLYDGYPLKLRVATRLGFKNPKLITPMWVGDENRGSYWGDTSGKGVSSAYNLFSGS